MVFSSTKTTTNFSDLGTFTLNQNQAVNSNFDGLKELNEGYFGNYNGQISQEEISQPGLVPDLRTFEQNASLRNPFEILESIRSECLERVSKFLDNIMATGTLSQAEHLLKVIREATLNEESQRVSQGPTSANFSSISANLEQKPTFPNTLQSDQNNYWETMQEEKEEEEEKEKGMRTMLQSTNLLAKENSAFSNTKQGETRRKQTNLEGLALNQSNVQHYPQELNNFFLRSAFPINQPCGLQNAQVFESKQKTKQSEGKNIQVSVAKRVGNGIKCVKDDLQDNKPIKIIHDYIKTQLVKHILIDEEWGDKSPFKLFISLIQGMKRSSYKEIREIAARYPQYKVGFLACVLGFLSENEEQDFIIYITIDSKLNPHNREYLRNNKEEFRDKLTGAFS